MLLLLVGVVAATGIILGAGLIGALAIALVAGLVYFLVAAGSGVQTVIAAARARPARPDVRAEKLLIHRVEELALASGLPPPKVYVQDSRDINAFAAGKNPKEAIICVTTGALDQLDQEELQGVLGHEMSHIQNYDVRLATYTVAVVGLIAILAEIVLRMLRFAGRGGRGRGGAPVALALVVLSVLFIVLAPLLSRLVYFAMSRRREFLADASGAYMTRNPEGLARALEKIQHDLPDDPKGSKTVAALYIANPWKRARRNSVWSTHPPLDRRIEQLRGPGWQTWAAPPAPRIDPAPHPPETPPRPR